MDTRYIEPTQTTKTSQPLSSHLNCTNEFIPPDPVAKLSLPHVSPTAFPVLCFLVSESAVPKGKVHVLAFCPFGRANLIPFTQKRVC